MASSGESQRFHLPRVKPRVVISVSVRQRRFVPSPMRCASNALTPLNTSEQPMHSDRSDPIGPLVQKGSGHLLFHVVRDDPHVSQLAEEVMPPDQFVGAHYIWPADAMVPIG